MSSLESHNDQLKRRCNYNNNVIWINIDLKEEEKNEKKRLEAERIYAEEQINRFKTHMENCEYDIDLDFNLNIVGSNKETVIQIKDRCN